MLYPIPFKASIVLLDFIPHTDPSPPIKALQGWPERNGTLLCSPCVMVMALSTPGAIMGHVQGEAES